MQYGLKDVPHRHEGAKIRTYLKCRNQRLNKTHARNERDISH